MPTSNSERSIFKSFFLYTGQLRYHTISIYPSGLGRSSTPSGLYASLLGYDTGNKEWGGATTPPAASKQPPPQTTCCKVTEPCKATSSHSAFNGIIVIYYISPPLPPALQYFTTICPGYNTYSIKDKEGCAELPYWSTLPQYCMQKCTTTINFTAVYRALLYSTLLYRVGA
ncbi:hypothetical protein B9Z19DRAFT_1111327 [Tuber borchii]|uniref:Uncharacterized protein n=1 Tax=Tuber borchii TaxID=42251 RepID=A0A2T6ZCL0_TUBBO|nr:hypothetical protein B9Z19DRAFT_1111327 [Tuber borchii]